MFASRASGAAVLLLLVGHALAQDGGPIDRVQLGDNDLDCVQIAAQVAQLDAILAPHSGDQGAVRGATESVTRSRTGQVVAGVAKVLPFGGIFGDIAKDVLGRRGRDAETRLAAARARKEYLVDMFLKRGCRVSDVAAAAAKPPASPNAAPDARPPAELSAPGGEPADTMPRADVPAAAPSASAAGPPTAPDSPRAAPPASGSSQPSDQAGPAPRAPAVEQPDGFSADEPAAHQAAPRGPLFMLDFRLAFRTSADADGASGAPGLELGGVTLKTMQAITDSAYVALLSDLEQAGFEVLNPELAASQPTDGSLPAPARAGDYLYFAPSGAPLAQAPAAAVPGSDAALAETGAALAQAVAGRRPGVNYGIAVWYVDFAGVSGAAGSDEPRQLESRLAVATGSHLALVEPAAGDATPPGAVRVMNLGRDLVSREPYGQVRLSGPAGALELKADPHRFRSLVERQLKRGRSALISSLPPVATAASGLRARKTVE